MVSRRQVLGLLAAANVIPSRLFAQTANPQLIVRSDLAKRFSDDGTAGVFAAYEVGSDSILTTDGERSSCAWKQRPTAKANSALRRMVLPRSSAGWTGGVQCES